MKAGWWKIRFDVMLDGVEIDFEELPDTEKRRIQRLLALGAVAGEVTVPSKDETGPWIGDKVVLNFGGLRGEIADVEPRPDGRTMFLVRQENGHADWYHAEQFKPAS